MLSQYFFRKAIQYCLNPWRCVEKRAVENRKVLSIEDGEFDQEKSDFYAEGLTALQQGNLDAAETLFYQAIQSNQSHAKAWNNLGAVAFRRGKHDAALDAFQRAIRIDPSLFESYSNLAILNHERGQIESAVAYFERARALAPKDPGLLCNLAMANWENGNYLEASRIIECCMREHPNHTDAYYINSYFSLAHGNYRDGWSGYEYRNRYGTPAADVLQIPKWTGQNIRGSRILITPEQGLGEQLLFFSCLTDLLARGAICVIVCMDKLKVLIQESFPNTRVLGLQESHLVEKFRPFDYQVSIADLGRYFRKSVDDFPREGGFLRVDQNKVKEWRTRLGLHGQRPRIGLAWTGGSVKTGGTLRSIELQRLLPILQVPNVEFVSLEYMDTHPDIMRSVVESGSVMHHFPLSKSDYSDTASLVSTLDLVISVSTSIVFLCAGLGVPAWVLLPVGPNWIYQINGETSPWLPGITLYRQEKAMEWSSVIDQVATSLQHFRVVNRSA